MAGLLDWIDQKIGTRLGLLASAPRAAMAQMNQQAGAYNQASLLATQAERNALRGLPVTPEQAAAKQYVDKTLEDVAMGFAGTVTPAVARQIPMKVNLPQSDDFVAAVQNTPGAQITEEGLLMKIQRSQVPEQAGKQSVRTGVFYLPEGSSNARYYSGQAPGKWYGGTEKISGETLLKNPLFVKGATGGKAPEVAFDTIKGKGAIKELDNDVSRIIGLNFIKKNDPNTYYEAVGEFLSKYGGDPSTARTIVENSQKGNQLKYALRENAIANTVRNAGHDAVLGYSKGKKGNFLSELFDLREATYPTKQGGYTLNPMFQTK